MRLTMREGGYFLNIYPMKKSSISFNSYISKPLVYELIKKGGKRTDNETEDKRGRKKQTGFKTKDGLKKFFLSMKKQKNEAWEPRSSNRKGEFSEQ